MQKGQIKRVGNCWLLRYYAPVMENGRVVKRQKTVKLTPQSDRPDHVRAAADLILAPINAQTAKPESRQELATFLEHVYLPYVNETKRPGTYRSYLVLWRLVKPHLNGYALRSVTTFDVETIMRAATSDKQRAHTTHLNLRNFLSGAFNFAVRKDLIATSPVKLRMDIPRGKPTRERARYSLEEVQRMLHVLPEPAKTFATVAAFTGLRVSEIKGLQWQDIQGDKLNVSRSVWQGKVQETKTLSSTAPVPLLVLVRNALKAHRKRTPGNTFIFIGSTGKPLHIENVFRRDIAPILKKHKITWKGWHAFRRGLGTNLNALGVDPKTIQEILRHGQLSTTMEIYVQPERKAAAAAMAKVEKAFAKTRHAGKTKR